MASKKWDSQLRFITYHDKQRSSTCKVVSTWWENARYFSSREKNHLFYEKVRGNNETKKQKKKTVGPWHIFKIEKDYFLLF